VVVSPAVLEVMLPMVVVALEVVAAFPVVVALRGGGLGVVLEGRMVAAVLPAVVVAVVMVVMVVTKRLVWWWWCGNGGKQGGYGALTRVVLRATVFTDRNGNCYVPLT